jgi:hypothetical protein
LPDAGPIEKALQAIPSGFYQLMHWAVSGR